MEEGDQGSHVLQEACGTGRSGTGVGGPCGTTGCSSPPSASCSGLPTQEGRTAFLHVSRRSLLPPPPSLPTSAPAVTWTCRRGSLCRVGDSLAPGQEPRPWCRPRGSAVSPAWSLPGLPAVPVPLSRRAPPCPPARVPSPLCTRPVCTAGSCLCLKPGSSQQPSASALRWASPDSGLPCPPSAPTPVHTLRPVPGLQRALTLFYPGSHSP